MSSLNNLPLFPSHDQGVLRQDVDKYIKSDSDVNKLEQKVTYIETTVDYLERTLKLISNRTFTIKNAIDWKKFTSGVI